MIRTDFRIVAIPYTRYSLYPDIFKAMSSIYFFEKIIIDISLILFVSIVRFEIYNEKGFWSVIVKIYLIKFNKIWCNLS